MPYVKSEDKMVKCIFCLGEKSVLEFTEEHVFPEAIGGTLVIKDVCKPCNDYLGHSIDSALTNHSLVELKRLALKIPGKSGRVPNPLERGVMADDPTQKLRYRLDKQGNPTDLEVVPQIVRTKLDEEHEEISIRLDAKDKDNLPRIVNTKLQRMRLPGLPSEEIERAARQESRAAAEMSIVLKVDLVQYKRAILKIAYELAWKWLGSSYLTDASAVRIRSCIMNSSCDDEWTTKYEIKAGIDIRGGETAFGMWREDQTSHLAFLVKAGNEMHCAVRIFNIFEGIIVVAEDGSLYSGFEGRFIGIDPVSGRLRDSTLAEECARLAGEQS